jgi:response regulator NasT
MGTILVGMTNKRIEQPLLAQVRQTGLQYHVVEDGNSLVRTARTRAVDLILLDEEIKGLRAIDLVNAIQAEKIAPVVLITQLPRTNYAHWIEKGWIFDYVHYTAETASYERAIFGALYFGKKVLELEGEILKLQKELAVRKTIEKAKGIIMEMKKCSEEEAYSWLRTSSMEKKVTMDVLAQAIIQKYS